MKRALLLGLTVTVALGRVSLPAAEEKSQADLRREAAIAEFTRKTKEANYPALFDAAAREFNVAADVLKGVAFAETRWEHLTWAPGDTASPDTGMPRPYGIMSLWDNSHFGHSLPEAAKLIGKTPEELKRDPAQNIRGAAALLRKLYDENPKPEGTTEADIESWRYAIRKYCGIPEPDLSARHVLEVYTFINQGYNQYGIEWKGRPVNLQPIRQETARIVAEEQSKHAARLGSNAPPPTAPELSSSPRTEGEARAERMAPTASGTATTNAPAYVPSVNSTLWFIGGALAALVLLLLVSRKRDE